MSGNDPAFNHTLQQELDDLREQAMLCRPAESATAFLPKPKPGKSP
jgi:hypothetical protein